MNSIQKIPTWFWVVSALALLWNLFGVWAFIGDATMSAEAIAELPEEIKSLYESYPLWTKIAYGTAVIAGALGCILLLARNKFAKPVLLISLVAVVVQMFHSLFIAGAMDVYGPGAVIMPIMVILVSVFLVWFANYGIKQQWLK